jgi:hypothetical protein
MNKQNQVKKKKCQIVILRRTPRKEKVGIQVLYILFQHSITCSANMEIKIKKTRVLLGFPSTPTILYDNK